MKKKFLDAHMSAAEVYAKLSSAIRLQVGCVIVKENTIIGIGYNGMPAGWENDCEYEYVEDDIHRANYGQKYLITKDEVLHAETNAIAKVARSTNSTEGATLFVTHAPCIHCAKLIHQSGISSVYYRDTYRDELGLDFLRKCEINVNQI